ncbi:hypothetical protein BTUL_0238g00060 [Botrytis tulipae]|uniref:Uncharacterized protein n=1 Tax=Botrytis tulipae TaxID=87230 RepID=A0A4Z1EBF0_9HELO|nr:hypothetical protein BTUL_0238g00060 [Botrytis tulipae]
MKFVITTFCCNVQSNRRPLRRVFTGCPITLGSRKNKKSGYEIECVISPGRGEANDGVISDSTDADVAVAARGADDASHGVTMIIRVTE